MARLILVYLLYWSGCAVSTLLDWVTTLYPRTPDWFITPLYRAYSRLMGWSGDLDIHEVCWTCRHEGESDEAFESRCRARNGA